MAGALDDAFNVGIGDESLDIVEDTRCSTFHGVCECGRNVSLFGPANSIERGFGFRDVEIRHAHDMKAGDTLSLGEDHGSKFAGANDSDPHRLSSRHTTHE
jgi:hypothetical protein